MNVLALNLYKSHYQGYFILKSASIISWPIEWEKHLLLSVVLVHNVQLIFCWTIRKFFFQLILKYHQRQQYVFLIMYSAFVCPESIFVFGFQITHFTYYFLCFHISKVVHSIDNISKIFCQLDYFSIIFLHFPAFVYLAPYFPSSMLPQQSYNFGRLICMWNFKNFMFNFIWALLFMHALLCLFK